MVWKKRSLRRIVESLSLSLSLSLSVSLCLCLSLSVSQGELFLNGQACRIIQRELLFDLGVAYGIDCLLIDPTLGGRCDTFTTFNVSVSPKNT